MNYSRYLNAVSLSRKPSPIREIGKRSCLCKYSYLDYDFGGIEVSQPQVKVVKYITFDNKMMVQLSVMSVMWTVIHFSTKYCIM